MQLLLITHLTYMGFLSMTGLQFLQLQLLQTRSYCIWSLSSISTLIRVSLEPYKMLQTLLPEKFTHVAAVTINFLFQQTGYAG